MGGDGAAELGQQSSFKGTEDMTWEQQKTKILSKKTLAGSKRGKYLCYCVVLFWLGFVVSVGVLFPRQPAVTIDRSKLLKYLSVEVIGDLDDLSNAKFDINGFIDMELKNNNVYEIEVKDMYVETETKTEPPFKVNTYIPYLYMPVGEATRTNITVDILIDGAEFDIQAIATDLAFDCGIDDLMTLRMIGNATVTVFFTDIFFPFDMDIETVCVGFSQ